MQVVLNQGARDVNEDLLLHIVVLFFEEEWTPPTLPYRHIQYEYNDFNYLFYCFISPPLILKSISMVIDVSMYVRIDMQAAESDRNT